MEQLHSLTSTSRGGLGTSTRTAPQWHVASTIFGSSRAVNENTLVLREALLSPQCAGKKRTDDSKRCDMGWTVRIAIGVAALLTIGVVALAIYAGTISPPHRTYQQVLSNDHFPG